MKLSRLYNIYEAGIQNAPVKNKKRKNSGHSSAKSQAPDENGSDDDDDGPEWDEDAETNKGFGSSDDDGDDLGPDMDYEDPAADDDSEGDPSAQVDDDEEEKPKASPFASKPQMPTHLPLGSGDGLSISGHEGTISGLMKALEAVRTNDDDLADWVDDCIRALGQAIRKGGGSATLPKFEATPSLDSFDDDDGGSDEEH